VNDRPLSRPARCRVYPREWPKNLWRVACAPVPGRFTSCGKGKPETPIERPKHDQTASESIYQLVDSSLSSVVLSVTVFSCLLVASLLGALLRSYLPDHH